MSSPFPLTAVVLTKNGARLLEPCLASLSFCSQILVVDSGSTDATLAIAQKAGATVLHRDWQGPVPQFEFAFAQVTTDWIITLDQDEVCSQELQSNIIQALHNMPASLAGFTLPRRSWYYDRFMSHSGWYPDRLFRLFHKERLLLQVSGAHESLSPKGESRALRGDILHYPYSSFTEHLDKINLYAQEGAKDLQRKGHRGGLLSGMLHGLGRFCKLYFIKYGFLDGKAGYINAVHGAFYAFLKYVRVNEGDWGAPFEHDATKYLSEKSHE